MLLVFPFCMVGATFALFSQNLSLSGTGTSVAYVSGQSLMMTYTTSQTGTSPYTYTIAMTLKNNATKATTVWQVDLTVPSDASAITCPATVTCALSGTKLTVLSNTNGAIAIGGTLAVSFTYKTATNAYVFQSIKTYANYTAAYATLSGLTVNVAVGTRTGSSGAYTWPVTVTITNNYGQPIGGWQVSISPWKSTYTLSGLPSGVTKSGTTTLVLTGANELATGTTYQFTWSANTKTTATWAPTSSIKGKS
jgi:hypothetical protein